MNSYKIFIVDDEVNNIALLEHFISKYCLNVELVGNATSVEMAIPAINTIQPDILFLDIRLNGSNAFEILDQIRFTQVQIIFVTSYDEYALKAFKYNAIDYILKPVVLDELILSINKAIKNIEQQKYIDLQKIISLDTLAPTVIESGEYLAIPSMDKVDFIKTDKIVYIEADSKYTIFRTSDDKKYISSKNLLHFERIVDKKRFFRIHHSYMINLEHMVKVIKKDGNYCEMDTGILLPISKRKQEDFNRFLKIKE